MEFTPTLIQDLTKLLEDSDEFNVTINVGENGNTKTFQAHSLILRARSPYFRTALSSEWAKKESDKIVFEKPNISPQIFQMILRYCEWLKMVRLVSSLKTI